MVARESLMKKNNLWTHLVQDELRWTLLSESSQTLCDSLRGHDWKRQTKGGVGVGQRSRGHQGLTAWGTAWPPGGASGCRDTGSSSC